MLKAHFKSVIATLLVIGMLFFACIESAVRVTGQTSGTVTQTANMDVPRFDHTATLLPDGKVLIAAGLERNGAPLKTAELFDPDSGRFISIGEMRLAHGWGSISVLLRTGKVLLAGGSSGPSRTLAQAELYDPTTHTFSLTGSMARARDGALSILLADGDVLVVGGEEGSSENVNTAELYHPSTGSFSLTGSMHGRDLGNVVLLKDGKVLAVGATSAELYDPSTGTFRLTGHLRTPRSKFGSAVLPDGKVLVAGGQINGAWGERVSVSEIYDPGTGNFASGPEMAVTRFKLRKSVVALKDGRILLGGGASQPEVYDPASRTFSFASGSTLDGFLFSTATLLNDGRVLLAGGYNKPGAPGVRHAWLYRP